VDTFRTPTQALDYITAQRGKDPINPNVIQGFEGNQPPPMERGLPPLPQDDFGLDMGVDDEPVNQPPPSPLIPRQFPKPIEKQSASLPGVGSFDFSELNEEDMRQISLIVLKAKKRLLDAALAAVAAPRRFRGPNKPKDAPKATEAASGAPRKSGRPKKVTA